MNSVFVYCEIEESTVADVSLELLTKGRTLANKLGVKLEAIALGHGLKDIEKQIFPYGADVVWVGDDTRLAPYTTLPHTKMLVRLFEQEKPQIAEVLAVGPGTQDDPMELKVGDKVIFSPYGGTEIKYGGEEVVVMNHRDILAVVE